MWKGPYSATIPTEIDICPNCRGAFLDPYELGEIKKTLHEQVQRPAAQSPVSEMAAVRIQPPKNQYGTVPDTLKGRLLAFPICIVISLAARWLVLPGKLLGFFSLSMHELGHAMAAWFTGRVAIPIPYGFTPVFGQPSITLSILVLMVWLGISAYFYLRRQFFLTATTGLIVAAHLYVGFILDAVGQSLVFSWGGVAGEFILGSLAITSWFFMIGPKHWRWDFWRYPVLLFGTYALLANTMDWIAYKNGTLTLPWGSLTGGRGDLESLRDNFAMTQKTIVASYLLLAKSCAIFVVGVWAGSAFFYWGKNGRQ